MAGAINSGQLSESLHNLDSRTSDRGGFIYEETDHKFRKESMIVAGIGSRVFQTI